MRPVAAAAEGDQGAQLLRAVDSGRRTCDELTMRDFEAIGEYAMGRMVGSTQAHQSMDELMRSMMGKRSEQQIHEAMGRRFGGCGGARVSSSFGGMLGVMGMMGGPGEFGPGGSGSVVPGMKGGYSPGSMMGGVDGRVHGRDNDNDAPGWAVGLIAGFIALVLLGALAAILGTTRRRSGVRPAHRILEERYASGQLDHEEFERRRNALGGSA